MWEKFISLLKQPSLKTILERNNSIYLYRGVHRNLKRGVRNLTAREEREKFFSGTPPVYAPVL